MHDRPAAEKDQAPERHRYWITFDLGLTGDYEHFYRWLDTIGAEECGSGLATFTSDKDRQAIEAEIESVRQNSPRARIYLISKTPEGSLVGKFLSGGRTVAPWAGYADRPTDVEDVA